MKREIGEQASTRPKVSRRELILFGLGAVAVAAGVLANEYIGGLGPKYIQTSAAEPASTDPANTRREIWKRITGK